EWDGPLVLLTGNNLKVTGNNGELNGQGDWYWSKDSAINLPVFFRLLNVDNSVLSIFKLTNSPFRTFSILNSIGTNLTLLTLTLERRPRQEHRRIRPERQR
ncbi:hypothetical protein Gpo141_00014859, partial [Globisporangium polare]